MDLRVGILDDHRSLAEAMGLALAAAPGFECVGIATSLDECYILTTTLRPDVLLVDYQLFEGNGLICAERLAELDFEIRLVLLSAHASPDLAARAAEVGIEQVLSKDAPLLKVLDAVRSAASNPPLNQPGSKQIVFSSRQREVLELMGEGLDPASIAERLFISVHTARSHVKDVMKLLGAPTQLAAVTQAQRDGYLVPPRTVS